MLDYDLASEKLLVVLKNSCAMVDLNQGSSRAENLQEDSFYDCSSTVGGIGFLAFGARCVVSVPHARHL